MIFDESNGRSSEDHPETIDYVKQLICDGTIKIDDVLVFFNYACGAYRQASTIITLSDSKINIEFNYAARAFASYIKAHNNNDAQGVTLALLDAFQASRHIVNDALDIILFQITDLIDQSKEMTDHTRLFHLINNYTQKLERKDKIHEIVAQSRRLRGTFRYEKYLEIINGEAYKELLNFLNEIKYKFEDLIEIRNKEQAKNFRNLILAWSSIIIGLVGTFLVGFFPDEAKEIGSGIKSYIKSKYL